MDGDINGKLGFYEFFAGGGMARLGLGAHWQCLFANDNCQKKADAYRFNFNSGQELVVYDICNISTDMLPKGACLAWASFPCQDLSLAGFGNGLRAERSGAFWPFWKLLTSLDTEGRGVPVIVLENVQGLITSKRGRDFRELVSTLTKAGYRVGPLVIDAVYFVPQSRQRLFIVAIKENLFIPSELSAMNFNEMWHTKSIVAAYNGMPDYIKNKWLWWQLPMPKKEYRSLSDIIEMKPTDVKWHTKTDTNKLLTQMSAANIKKVKTVQAVGKLVVGTVYKRTRKNSEGGKIQRAEVRFDGISGCLRTPAGGSSRQIILIVEGNNIRSRLLSSREAARLMGLNDSYILPERYNDSYHLVGDGLVIPVVSWLERHLLRPLVNTFSSAEAA